MPADSHRFGPSGLRNWDSWQGKATGKRHQPISHFAKPFGHSKAIYNSYIYI